MSRRVLVVLLLALLALPSLAQAQPLLQVYPLTRSPNDTEEEAQNTRDLEALLTSAVVRVGLEDRTVSAASVRADPEGVARLHAEARHRHPRPVE